eukprot:15359224-Ditylum_brightwellii.AAC.1
MEKQLKDKEMKCHLKESNTLTDKTEIITKQGPFRNFDDDMLDIPWGMVIEEGKIILDLNEKESSNALTSMLRNMSRILGIFDKDGADDDIRPPDTGMAAMAASAVSAVEQVIHKAAKMTLNKGNSYVQESEIDAEVIAAIEATVELQPNQQDLPQQSQPL